MKLYKHFLRDFELEKYKKNVSKIKNSKRKIQDGGENVFFILKFQK
jgi:hypothetical protein